MNESEIFTGAVKDAPDVRDFKLDEIAGVTPPFDWEKGYDVEKELGIKIKIKDQGNSYSCGGQAWSYYGGVLKSALLGIPYEEFSAKFIYSQTFVPGGGSGGRENSNIVIKQGWGSELLTPSYQNGQTPSEAFMQMFSDITAEARAYALKNIALSYATTSLDIDTIAKAARDNHGTIIGITGSNNGTWRSAFPQKPTKGEWNHWLYVGRAKMINGKKYIGVCNSWGESTGEVGWQWIGEEYFDHTNVWSDWTIIAKKQDTSKPIHTFNTNMVYGHKGIEVYWLQKCLIAEKLPDPLSNLLTEKDIESVPSNSIFGPKTLRTVLAFQEKYKDEILKPAGLGQANGKVLIYTRAMLNRLYGITN